MNKKKTIKCMCAWSFNDYKKSLQNDGSGINN